MLTGGARQVAAQAIVSRDGVAIKVDAGLGWRCEVYAPGGPLQRLLGRASHFSTGYSERLRRRACSSQTWLSITNLASSSTSPRIHIVHCAKDVRVDPVLDQRHGDVLKAFALLVHIPVLALVACDDDVVAVPTAAEPWLVYMSGSY
jgi:hypothetical protein